MSKQVIVIAKCDYPECTATSDAEVDVWFYKPGKGRKPAPVRIDLCDDHLQKVALLHQHFSKVGDSDNASTPENRSTT